jgi:hypothetical protein
MHEQAALDRREFTLRSALALLGGTTILISPGCGGGGGGYQSPSAPSSSGGTTTGGAQPDTLGTISSNHGHQAVITAAQLAAGGVLQLNIQGAADHPHMVELTADDLQKIKSQQSVSRECSSTSAHTHMVTFLRNSDAPPGSGY